MLQNILTRMRELKSGGFTLVNNLLNFMALFPSDLCLSELKIVAK